MHTPTNPSIENARDPVLEARAIALIHAAHTAIDRSFGIKGYATRNPDLVVALVAALSNGQAQRTA